MVKYICNKCKTTFDHKAAYDRHINRKNKCSINKVGSKTKKKINSNYCEICNKTYNRKDALIRHRKTTLHKSNINNSKTKVTKILDKVIVGSHNKQILTDHSYNNSHNNNSININATTNNYYISPFGEEEINKLTTQDKLAILLSNQDPIIQIIVKTNLNSAMPEYHNIGYIDVKSGYGYIYNGESWEKKEVRLIMNDLLNFKERDLRKIHKEVSKYMTVDDNTNIINKLQDIDRTIIPTNGYNAKTKKKLVANLKAQFYNKRNLIIDAIERSGKPVLSKKIEDEIKPKIILKDGMTIEELDKILIENRRKSEELLPKKEIAKYIIKLIKSGLSNTQFQRINEVIDDIIEEQEINTIMRVLCETYYNGNYIDINTIKQKIHEDKQIDKLIKKR